MQSQHTKQYGFWWHSYDTYHEVLFVSSSHKPRVSALSMATNFLLRSLGLSKIGPTCISVSCQGCQGPAKRKNTHTPTTPHPGTRGTLGLGGKQKIVGVSSYSQLLNWEDQAWPGASTSLKEVCERLRATARSGVLAKTPFSKRFNMSFKKFIWKMCEHALKIWGFRSMMDLMARRPASLVQKANGRDAAARPLLTGLR